MISRYRKSLLATVAAIISATVAANTDNVLTSEEWVNVAIAGATAAGVWLVPDTKEYPYIKTALAGLMAALTTLVAVIGDGVTGTEQLQIVLAILAVFGVGAVSNEPKVTS